MNSVRLKIWIFVCSWFCAFSVAAQSQEQRVLAFEVCDSVSLQPLQNVSCQEVTDKGRIISYALTNVQGKASVKVSGNHFIVFSSMGYGKRRFRCSAFTSSDIHKVYLSPKEVSLKEVFVKVPPIRSHGDTLSYNVKSFLGAGDKHLEDVLKKLPGVKVADNGTVSVQGKAINKFYIEGLDLLGNSYGQATKNMPLDAVTSVEVLENHQPVKLLKDKQLPDQAAINIRIDKKHMGKPFGELMGGFGFPASLWNNKLFVTQLLGKSQLLLTGKMNNSGEDLSGDVTEHIDVSSLDTYEPMEANLLNTSLSSEVLSSKRYAFNKSYAGGVNLLTKLSPNSTLRLNTLLYADHTRYGNESESNYGGIVPVRLYTSIRNFSKKFTISPIIKYELNSNNTFISEELTYKMNHTSLEKNLNTNGTDVTEQARVRPSYFQNIFRMSFNLGKQLIQSLSFVRYFNRKEDLNDASQQVNRYNVAEQYLSHSWLVKNKLSTTLGLFGNSLELGLQTYYRHRAYDYTASGHATEWKISLFPSYYIRYGMDSGIRIELPVSWNKASMLSADTLRRRKSFLSVAPAISFRHQFSPYLSVYLSGSWHKEMAVPQHISPVVLRTGYRSSYEPSCFLDVSSSYRLSGIIKYKNPIHLFFLTGQVAYSAGKAETYRNIEYTDAYTVVNTLRGSNHRNTFMAGMQADKSFSTSGLSMKLGVSYTLSGYLLSQSSVLTTHHSNVLAVNLGVDYKKLSWLRLFMETTGSMNWDKNSSYTSDKYLSMQSEFTLFLSPIKHLEVRGSYDFYLNEIAPSHYKSAGLFDVSAQYKLNKVWELGLSLTNLMNVKEYSVTETSGLDTYFTRLPLRGRELLASVTLHF